MSYDGSGVGLVAYLGALGFRDEGLAKRFTLKAEHKPQSLLGLRVQVTLGWEAALKTGV